MGKLTICIRLAAALLLYAIPFTLYAETGSSLSTELTPHQSDPHFASGSSTPPSKWHPEDTDLRILEINAGGYRFDDVIAAYQFQNTTLLPLGHLSSILDLAITVDQEGASGFFFAEENSFHLDITRNEVTIRARSSNYPVELVQPIVDDIYVDSNLLMQWLDITFNVDLYASRLTISSSQPLPFQLRMEREQRSSKISHHDSRNTPKFTRINDPYLYADVPFIDQTISIGQRFSDNGDETTVRSTTYATGDLLQHEASAYISANDQEGVDIFRLTLGRSDPDGQLLGPMGATQYQFGHVLEPRVALINTASNTEYGVTVSSHPLGLPMEFERHRFTGVLLPGWEVELYRNNALLGYQPDAADGQYDFQDVPLLFGSNHFRLVFYGPKGEVREESMLFQLSNQLTPTGEHYYRLSAISDENDNHRSTLQYNYGLRSNLTAHLNHLSIPLLDASGNYIRHDYLKAGFTGYMDAVLASLYAIDDSASGNAVELGLQTRVGGVAIALHDTAFNRFYSEEYPVVLPEMKRESQITLNSAIPPSFLPRIPILLDIKRKEYVTGDELVETTNQISMSTHGFAITNYLHHQKLSSLDATANGHLNLSTQFGQSRIRGTLGYTIKPEQRFDNIDLHLTPGRSGNYQFGYGINHSLSQDMTSISARATRLSRGYGLSFGGSYNTNHDLNLDLNFSIGIGYEPRHKQFINDARTIANQGSISARFFIDSNQDGLFNNGDQPLRNIGLRINNGSRMERSNEDGILFISGLPSHRPTNITIDPSTLTDPTWKSTLDGIEIVPRPGHASQVDFPVTFTGEIDGTVYLLRNGRKVGVGNVTVELVDGGGNIVSTTKTAFDGFYILTHAPLGVSTVRISADQLEELDLQQPHDEVITIYADNPFINGIDFDLNPI
ncbi:MAG: carboxypeptidase-like regulatory domain-containing protein [Chromatiales bacterium]|nr:carboxypeptidase-like regulatory domain-containing protein [Chromatiales bacterium]